ARCTSWFWPWDRPHEIHWGNTFDVFLMPAFQKRYGETHLDWDALAARITMDAVRDQPVEYLRIWSQVFTEFWTAYVHLEGYYASVEDIERQRPVVRASSKGLFEQVEKVNRYVAWLSLPILLAAFAAALSHAPHNYRDGVLFISVYCVLY